MDSPNPPVGNTLENPLDVFLFLMQLTIIFSEPDKITRTENEVKKNVGLEKVGMSDIILFITPLLPYVFFVTFILNHPAPFLE